MNAETILRRRAELTPHREALVEVDTGRPKGAMIPHRQILWNAINTVISWELSSKAPTALP